ncbi:L,D-transpeptidase [Cronbergia sp. UHCC 0137]|uniref:L,D-transpeptidase n=1 Tax=Cronbergia sp. UHCC 0137 TaxID=3110239 RepID=UPI002B2176E0|nr:L,D-transpeptidase [Cronbergia sp. UHCC 0137]MEA5620963.1 L,D-transpeptidase [Cronbergia sp. UHCC 0137]
MAMARNQSVASMVMLLCFGTATLSLAVHWHSQTMTKQIIPPDSQILRPSQSSSLESGDNNTLSVGIGNVALGAPVPPVSKKSSVTKTRQEKKPQKNVASKIPQVNKLVGQEPVQEKTGNKFPQKLLSGFLPKPANDSVSNPTQLVVDLSDRRVYVYRYDEVIASYPVAVGKEGWETPTGTFQVMHKQLDPIWQHPITGKIFEAGTDSPLGDRWIGFWSDGRNEIGFHGTPNVDLLGDAVSHGCLRMRNTDVRMLYDQVQLGTSVLVRS